MSCDSVEAAKLLAAERPHLIAVADHRWIAHLVAQDAVAPRHLVEDRRSRSGRGPIFLRRVESRDHRLDLPGEIP